jgi:hypothetical protein
MSRNLAKLACLVVGMAAGWAVLVNLNDVFTGWVPPVGGLVVMVVTFVLLYFPLARPIADYVTDRVSVITHRGRHIRSGSGIDHIPDAPKKLTCTLCGGPGGPICPRCNSQMTTGRQSRISLDPRSR